MYERGMIVADWMIIVDDNAADLQIAESALKNIGINTTALKSGQELLDYLLGCHLYSLLSRDMFIISPFSKILYELQKKVLPLPSYN